MESRPVYDSARFIRDPPATALIMTTEIHQVTAVSARGCGGENIRIPSVHEETVRSPRSKLRGEYSSDSEYILTPANYEDLMWCPQAEQCQETEGRDGSLIFKSEESRSTFAQLVPMLGSNCILLIESTASCRYQPGI